MKRGWLHAPGATSGHGKKQKRPGAASPVALLLAVCMLCTLAVPAAAQEWSTPETAALAEETPAGETPDPTATPAPTAEPAPDPAPEDGGKADPAPATAETAQEDEPEQPEQPEQDTPAGPATAETAQEAVEPGDTVPVEETLKFATEDVSILVKVSGEATVAEEAALPPEGAQKIVAEPADETETVETEPAEGEQEEQDEQDPAADEAEPAVQALSAQKAAAAAPDAETAPVQEAELEVAALPESQPEYKQAVAYIEESAGEDGVLMVSALRFDFYYQGQPLDVSACEVTAEVRPTEALMNEARTVAAEKQAEADAAAEAAVQALAEDGEEEEPLEKPETRQGVEFVALQSGNDTAERLDGAFIEADTQETPVLTAALTGASPVMMLAARETTNPTFTVQYYANLEVTDRDTGGYLEIIDTSNGGTNQGGKLPVNGTDPATTGLYLVDAGNGKREVRTSMELTELYSENQYDYWEAPGLPYVNVFRGNGNYRAKQVWVLKEGGDANSTSAADWTIINVSDPSQVRLTNNPNDPELGKNNNVILIEQGTVLRLVANQTESPYDNAATFYDYDITDDGWTTWDSTYGSHGINSGSNYTGSGAKLAFGNANTGTALQNESWNGNTLNQYNHSGNGLLGCTFGLVTGLDSNGHIQYASGVDAPKLFDDGNANGKTVYSGWSLGFNRVGDTYTLSSVNGAGLDGLEYFNNPQTPGKDPYTHIWTNNFWPLDGKTGTDGLTGKHDDRGDYVGYGGNNMYPVSDDGQAHNNMFGMQYTLQFELTEDYVGPLEYYFFGDDDMWVFLDGKLVCDIGGVHSSVGAYVNLWDYIAKGDAGKHTLKFYYTERGLSGSTCYMQFTLPSVSQVPPEYQNAQLKILKQVQGDADPNQVFDFTIHITDKDNNPIPANYLIEIYEPNGTQKGSEPLEGGTGRFSLKANEYAIIRFLQYGTKYTISETACPGYTVTTIVDKSVEEEAAVYKDNKTWTANGEVESGNNSNITFINKVRPKLPETGGSGTLLYTTGGTALLAAALLYDIRRRKAQRSKPQ